MPPLRRTTITSCSLVSGGTCPLSAITYRPQVGEVGRTEVADDFVGGTAGFSLTGFRQLPSHTRGVSHRSVTMFPVSMDAGGSGQAERAWYCKRKVTREHLGT
jgi:hypothetical protein